MSLLLCRQEHVKRPYFMESMGIHLYSSQELSYVIFNHPMLVLDGFVDERLLAFLREELNQGFLALKLERWLKSGENPDEALMIILQECDYYSMAEVGRFRQMAATLRKKHPAEFMCMKADELFSLRQYGRAVKRSFWSTRQRILSMILFWGEYGIILVLVMPECFSWIRLLMLFKMRIGRRSRKQCWNVYMI